MKLKRGKRVNYVNKNRDASSHLTSNAGTVLRVPPPQKISTCHPPVTSPSPPIHLHSAPDPTTTKNKYLSPPNHLLITTHSPTQCQSMALLETSMFYFLMLSNVIKFIQRDVMLSIKSSPALLLYTLISGMLLYLINNS